MSKNVVFSNIDVELMKSKLAKFNEIEDNITDLNQFLDEKVAQTIKPLAFLDISPTVHDKFKNINDTPLTQNSISNLLYDAAINDGVFFKIDMKFKNRLVDIIKKIIDLRDQIEFADSNNNLETVVPVIIGLSNESKKNYGNSKPDSSLFEIKSDVTLTLPNKKEINIKAGKYDVVDYKYDKNGNLEALAIVIDNQKIWLYVDKNENILKYVIETNGVYYSVLSPLSIPNSTGNMVTIPIGNYEVLQATYNNAGQLIGMTILVGGVELDCEVKDGQIVGIISSRQGEYEIKEKITLTFLNGKKLVLDKGKYKIIDCIYNNDGSIKSLCIEFNGYKIWLELDSKENIVKIIVMMNGEIFYLDKDLEFSDENGTKIIITRGNYTLLESIYDANGVLIQIAILLDGRKIIIDVKNGQLISIVNVEEKFFELKEQFSLRLPNGKIIKLEKGKYRLIDVLYDKNGVLLAVCIEADNHRIWLYLGEDGNIIKVKVIINNGKFTIDSEFRYVDDNGNEIIITNGVYPLLEAIYDNYGNLIQVVILVDEKKITIDIRDGKVIGIVNVEPATITINETMYAYASDGTLVEISPGEYNILRYLYDKDGNIIAIVIQVGEKVITLRYFNGKLVGIKVKPASFSLTKAITVTLPDGTTLSIPVGDYKIVDAIYDENGNLTAVCIIYDDYKFWLYLDTYGNVIRVEYIKIIPGVFHITSLDLVVRDKFGNILENVQPGDYYIYEVRYDQNGNIIAVRISPDGEDEVWVYLNQDSQKDEISFFDKNVEKENSMLSLFDNKKKILGVLGVLFISAGAYLAVKRRKKKKIEDGEYEEDDYEQTANSPDENSQQEKIGSGNYAVYEIIEDNENNIKEARITPDDVEEQYWVEM